MSSSLRWRLSLRMLMLATAVTAVSCAALKHPSEWWRLALATIGLLAFMAALVTIVVDRGGRRAFAIGFLLCGALHWAGLRWVDELPTRLALEGGYYYLNRATFDAAEGADAALPYRDAASKGQLMRGDTGMPVRALQTALNELLPSRYPITVDGDFGANTYEAVIAFQQSHGHPTDGVVTLATWDELGAAGRRALRRHGVSQFVTVSRSQSFLQIGGWVITLLIALLGGLLAEAVYTRRLIEVGPAEPGPAE